MQVTIYHNAQRDEAGRATAMLDGWKPEDPMVPVFTYDVATDTNPYGEAERAFRNYNAPEEVLAGIDLAHALAYRIRRLRSLSVGDVVKVGDALLACASFGFDEIESIRVEAITLHGTVPLNTLPLTD